LGLGEYCIVHGRGEVGADEVWGTVLMGSRIDKKQSFSDKVTAVNKLLAEDGKES
jgi:hypothetical protein